MKKVNILLCTLIPLGLIANTNAIEKLNYSISTNYADSKSSKQISLNTNVRMPLANYIGLDLNAGASKIDFDNNDVDGKSKFYRLGLLLRDHSIGKVQTSYSNNISSFKVESTSLQANSKTLNINTIYYYNNFDISVSHSKCEQTYDTYDSYDGKTTHESTSYQTNYSIAYYIGDNFRVITSKQDDIKYKPNFHLSYQPQKFNNLLHLSGSYDEESNNKMYQISYNYKSFSYSLQHCTLNESNMFQISYTFNKVHSIKDGIRKY